MSQLNVVLNDNVEGSPSYIRLTSTGYKYHQSIMNGIDRVANMNVPVLCFDEYLDQDDYDLLRNLMDVPHLAKGHERHTTIVANGRYPISMISHAVSMTAIHNSPDTVQLIEETTLRKVYFALGDPTSLDRPRPFRNTASYPKSLHSHDFLAYVYTRESIQEDWRFNREESDIVQSKIRDIFVYNEMQVLVEYNKSILVIVKPSWCQGQKHPKAIPCIRRYQWILNPDLMVANDRRGAYNVVNDDYTLLHKIEGHPSAKELFTAIDVEEHKDAEGKVTRRLVIPQNKFGKPYGIDLVFIYNGKMDCARVVTNAIDVLIGSLDLLSQEIALPTIMTKESFDDRNEQILAMPKLPDADLRVDHNGKFGLLIDDSILHMVSVKVMEMVDEVIQDELDMWQMTSIYYRVPHRLIPAAELHVKLPQSAAFTDRLRARFELVALGGSALADELTQLAIAKCQQDLLDIRSKVDGVLFPRT